MPVRIEPEHSATTDVGASDGPTGTPVPRTHGVASPRHARRTISALSAALLILIGPVLASVITAAPAAAASAPGPVYSWGDNSSGELGNGSTTDSLAAVEAQLPADVTVTAVSAGADYSLAVTSTGSVYGWGANSLGELGNGVAGGNDDTPVEAQFPVGVTITAVAAGFNTSLALTSTGTLYAWGLNNGAFGNGTTTNSAVPVAVSLPEGLTATAIAEGLGFSLALTSTGAVYAWGNNTSGQLGNGTETSSTTPVEVSLPATATAIAAGELFALAVTSTGAVYDWGFMGEAAACDGIPGTPQCPTPPTWLNTDSPTQVALPGGVVATGVAGGDADALAVTSTGAVYGWGDNENAQLGNNTTTSSTSPVAVDLPGGVSATAVSAGADFSVLLTATGSVYTWGDDASDELGYGVPGSQPDALMPEQAPQPGGSSVSAISAGQYHTAALVSQSTQTINFASTPPSNAIPGQIYTVSATDTSNVVPITFSISPSTAANCTLSGTNQVEFAQAGTCTIDANQSGDTLYAAAPQVAQNVTVNPAPTAVGQVYGWGNGYMLNDGSETNADAPVPIDFPAGVTVTQVSSQNSDAIALASNGSVYTWGQNATGGLGNGTTTPSPTPIQISFSLPTGVTVTQVSAGTGYDMALTSNGKVYAWGNNAQGQLGIGTTGSFVTTPTLVPLPGGAVATQVAASDGATSMVLTSTGAVYSWGLGSNGELGQGSVLSGTGCECTDSPAKVALPGGVVATRINNGSYVGMALTSTGAVYSWGLNGNGELGSGSTTPTETGTPQLVDLPTGVTATSIGGGPYTSMAVSSSGALYAWGEGGSGELGNGTTENFSDVPVQVELPGGVSAFSATSVGFTSMVLATNGTVYAWGAGSVGLLGNGTTTAAQDTPVVVSLPAGSLATAIGGGDYDEFAVLGDIPQTVTFTSTPPASAAVGGVYTAAATASSGLAVSYSVPASSSSVCALTSATVTFTAAGTCVIDANQAGNVLYAAAPEASQSISVAGASNATGSVYAWGTNAYGQLGDGTTTSSAALVLAHLPAGVEVTAVSGGAFDSLALTSTGQVYAWGDNASGELGNGSTTSSDVPVLVQFPGGVVVTAISAGANDANLALTSTGTVYAWGDGATGQIGNGSTNSSDVPVAMSFPGGAVITGISAGSSTDLAVTSTGKVYAWGDNEYGGLGDGATLTTGCDCADSPALVQLPGGVKATGVSMGAWFGTALTSTGAVYSWGIDVQGELGNGTTLSSTCSCDTTPSLVDLPGGVDITTVVAGANQTMAITTTGSVYAWGLALFGEMGDGGTGNAACGCEDVPVTVDLPSGSSVVAISEGNDDTLAILSTGAVYTWGGFVLSPTPVSLPGGAAASAVAIGYNFYLVVVGQQSQTITFDSTPPASPIVGGTYAVSATASSGLPVTLSVSPESASECSLVGSTVTFVGVGLCTIDADQSGDAAFGPAPPADQVVAVGSQSQTIGFSTTPPTSPVVGNTYPVAATATSGLTVNLTVDPSSTSVCSIQAGTVDLIGAGTCTIDANQAGSSSYGPAPQVQQSVVVGRTSQTITFSSTAPSSAVPGTTYTVAATSTSGLTVTFSIAASSSSVCSIAGPTVSFLTTGTCTIDANQAGSATYAPAPQLPQPVAVGQDTQTISFTSTVPASPVVGGTYPVTATATSGLPVSLSIDSSSTSVCTISGTTSGSTVTFKALGTCTIDAAQSGNVDYSAAPPLSQSVTGIAAGSQTITFTSTPAAGSGVGGTYTVSATASSGLAVTFKIDGSSTVGACTITGATVSFTGSGTCVIDANQSGLPNYNPAPQVQQDVTVADISASCTIEWTGGTGDWTTIADWTTTGGSPTNRLPTSTDVTCIPAGSDVALTSSDPSENSGNLLLGNVDGSGTATLQVSGTLTIQNATIYTGATLSVSSTGSVTQDGTLTNTGNVSVTGTGSAVVFKASGTFANDTGGSITVNSAGAFVVTVDATFNEDGGTTSGSPVLIQDAFLNFDGGGAADFSIENDGSSDVDGVPYAGQTLTIQAGETIALNPGTGNTNAGTIELQPGASTTTINNEGTFTNNGTIEVDAAAANTFAEIENGTITSPGDLVDNGAFTLTGTFTNTGGVTVGAAGALTENGTFNNDAGGSITITTGGSFTVESIFNEDGGTTSGSPVLIQDATLNFNGGGAADFSVKNNGTTDVNGVPYAGQDLTIQAGETIALNPGTGNTNAGTIELQPGGSTTTINNEGTFASTGTIEVDAAASDTFAEIENGTINSSGALVDNGAFTLTGIFTNTGSVTVGAAGALTENGTFNNDAGGSITITTGGSFTVESIFNEDGGTTSGSPVLIHDATLDFDGGGAADFSVENAGTTDVDGVPYAGQTLTIQAGETIALNPGTGNTNAGTIEFQPGGSTTTINNEGTFASTGTIEVDAAASDTFAEIENGTINSSGALVDNGAFTLTGIFTNTGSVTVGAAGALTENGTFNNDAGGSITITTGGSFTVESIFNEDGGTTSGSPVLIHDATLDFDGGGAADFSVENAGTTDVTGLPFTGQTLTLQPGVSLALNPGTNSGTIELQPGASTTTINNEGTFTNNGTIEVDAAAANTFAEIENGTITSPGDLVDNGAFTLTGTFTNTGGVTVGAAGALTENGTFNNDAGGSITITTGGSFTVESIFNEDGGTTSGSPVLIQDATLNFNGGGAADFSVKNNGTTDVNGVPYAGQDLTIQAGETIALNPGTGNTNAGTIELQPGGSTTTINNEGTFASTGTIEVDAAASNTFAEIENGTINSSGALVDNGAFTMTGIFTNTGGVTVGASGALTENGTFNNDAGGSITITTGGSFTVESIFNEDGGTTSGTTSSTTPGAPVLIHDATLNFDGGGAADFSVENAGTTDVNGVPYAGQTLTIQPSETIALNPGTGNTNAGTIQLEAGSTINNEGTFTNTGLIDAQVSASAGVTIENGTIINNGNVILETGNTTDITGTFMQGSAGTLTVDMGAATGFGNVVTGSTSLAGTLVVNTDFMPTVGSIFTIVASTALSTVFSTYVFNGYADYSVEYGSNDVKLLVTSGEASSALSTATASPSSVTANGSAASTITVTLEDASGNPVAGKSVSLSSNSSTSVIDVLSGTTNSAGIATFSVTDTVTEVVTYQATDASEGLILTEMPQVTFTPGPVSSTTSTTTASPPTLTADGVEISTVTVTLKDAEGNPVPGETVSLSANSSNTVVTTVDGVTNSAGEAVFSVTDTVAETVTYTPVVLSVSGLETAQVVFTSGPPSESTSTVTASPVSVTDNGSATTTITVTVEDVNGNPVAGQTVSVSQDLSGDSSIDAVGGVTNNAGVATFTAFDGTSQEVTYSATVDAVPITETATVSFNSGVSTTTSTVTASPVSVTDNGSAFSTITVTVQDASGTPIPGQTVTLAAGSGSSSITAINGVTNNAGVATFKVTDGTSQEVTYSATVDSVLLTSTATVSFNSGVSTTTSTVTASPVSVTDNGSAFSTITVTVQDASGTPIPGQTVTLAAGSGSSSITAINGVTNNAGVATFKVTDGTSQEVTYSATVDSVLLTSTATVSFNSGVSTTTSTVVAVPTQVAANGTSSSTITVTVEDASGTPIPGQTVTLAAGSGSSSITAINGVTNNAGQATFKVTDGTSEVVTYSATVDSVLLTSTATVTFGSGGVSATLSTVSASPVSVTDNGSATTTITVTVLNGAGDPVAGQTVTLAQGAGSSSIDAVGGVTNNAGVATFTAFDGTSQEVTYSATVDAVPITETATVSFNSGVSTTTSTVTASPVSVTDNGSAFSTITVTVQDASGTPIPGQTVTLAAGSGSSSITAINGVTNNAGVATFKVTDGTSQEVTYSATVDSVLLTSTATVSFNSGVSTTTSTVTASPVSVTDNGSAFSTITVTVQDASGTPIPGQTVTLAAGSGSSSITAINGVTNNAGVATFKVTDGTSQEVTYSATVDSVLLTSTATVSFNSGVSTTTSTVVAVPTQVAANGTSSSTITVTVEDASGTPIPGQTVTLAAGSGSSSITAINGVTNNAGQATFKVTDGTSEVVTYSATVDSVLLTSTATVTFGSGGVSATLSTVSASPVSVTDNGSATTTITVTVLNGAGDPVAGQTVTLAQGAGSSSIDAVGGVTNNAGVATFTAFDGTSQEVTYSATVDAVPITETATVSFNSGVSTTTSTVTASPVSVTDNGSAFSTITVTVQDASGTPIPGQTVTLAAGSGSSSITAINGVTNNAGVATFKVTDGTSQEVTYSATVDSVLLTSTATVSFNSGVSTTTSTVTASPVSVTDNGSAFSTITVTVQDASGTPIPGQTVTLAAGSGSSSITAINGVTNNAGVATFKVTDGTSQEVTYSATVDSVLLTSTATVSFNSGVSTTTSTVVAVPTQVAANGTSSSTITVTVEDASGTPIPGQTVTLAAGSGSSSITAINGVTNNAGQATFKVTDGTSEVVTYSATVDSVLLTSTATVTFGSGGVSATLSTVSASPVSVTDNGSATTTITVTVLNGAGDPVAGQTVTLAQGAGSSSIDAVGGVTNNAGVATFTAFDGTSQEVTYSATVDAVPITETATVSFNSGVSTTTSTVTASPVSVTDNGSAFSTITVTVQDASGTPIPGQTVTLAAGSGSSSITAINGVTNNAGVATFKVTDGTSQEVTYSATVDSVLLTSTATVSFNSGVSTTTSTVTASPVSVTDNGSAFSTITVTVEDASGTPIPGQTVTLAAGSGSSSITAINGVTNNAGQATFKVTDGTSQEVTYSATVDSVLLTSTATVSFNSGVSTTTSTVVAVPTQVAANGTSSSTITVTVEDASGTPIPGQTVTLAAGSGSSSITAINGVTNNAGQATFKVTDGTSEVVTYSATVDSVLLTSTATVTFGSGGVSATLSTVSASPVSVTDNGSATTTITVTVLNGAGDPVAGQTVTLAQGAGSSSIDAVGGVTNNAGVATFTAFDGTSQEVTYSATVDAVPITETATVSFNSGVSTTTSTVTASPVSVTDNGSAFSTITVTVQDASGTPIPGQTVTLAAGSGSSSITAINGVTNNAGVATFKVTDGTSEVVTYSATVDSVLLTSTATVTFGSGGVSATLSTVSASPVSVTDNGSATTTITVTVLNGAGDPVAGQTVTLAQGAGSSSIDAVGGVTNNAGVATFTAFDGTSQEVTYSATVDAVPITETATVSFNSGVSTTTSTVVANPTQVAANGTSSSTITVTVEDASGTPIPGQTVTLAAGTGSSSIRPINAVTNDSGVATFSVTDSTNEVVIYSATVDSVLLTAKATVTFGTGGVSQSNSTVTPSPTSVLDNGTTSTITVTLENTSGTPIPGQTVTLVQNSGGHSTITTVVGVTNAAGQATFTVADSTSQAVTYTATDTTAGVTLTNTGTVTFHGPVSATTSTVTANPTQVAANGTASSTITVTLEDASGTPVAGQTVSLAQSSGGHSTITALSATTNAAGQATFKVVDSINEVVTYSATDTSQSNLAITAKATVTFGTGGVSQSNSTVTPSPTSVLDNGTTSTITVTLENTSGTPIPGQTVTLVQNSGGHSTITTVVGVTNAAGQATFTVADSTSQAVTYTATDTTAGVTLTNTGTVTFHGPVSATTSTVTANPTQVAANGTASSTITVTLEDASGTPVAGQTVSLAQSSGGHSTITALSATTNAAGQATFKVVDSINEVVTYSATDTSQSNLAITAKATVTFGTGGVSQSNSTVTPSPTSVLDNGTTSTITVTLENTSGTPIPGQTVTLVQNSGGHSTITTVVGVTNAAGQATFTVADSTSQAVTYTATDTTAGVTLTNTGTVTFHGPVSATTSTVTANPTQVAANGTASSTITVTLEDASGTPVAGQTVSLAQSSGGHSTITALSATTNAAGQATFKVVDSINEVVTYSATDTSQSNLAITAKATVTFGTGGVSQSNSTVTPSPTSVLDNGTTSTITVTLENTSGTPIPGQTVTLVQNSGGHSTITTVVGVTNAAGQATFTVADSTSQAVTYTATDTTAGVTLTNTGTVTFHGPVSATTSTVTANPTQVAANGTASSTITVTLEDASGTPVAGQTVSLCQSSGGMSRIDGGSPGASATGVTNAKGQVTFTVTDTKAQAVTYTATDTSQSNLVIKETATVTFTAGTCSTSRSTLVASPTTVTANGTSTSTITVTLLDAEGNPVAGQTVTLSESWGGKSSIDGGAAGASISGVTNAEGQVTFTVTDTTAQCVTYTAVDKAESITLTGQVTFTSSGRSS